MTIMTCPRCWGRGSIEKEDTGITSTAQYSVTCPSCQGAGYVTDNPSQPVVKDLGAELVSAYIQCPHCGGVLKITPEFWKTVGPQKLK